MTEPTPPPGPTPPERSSGPAGPAPLARGSAPVVPKQPRRRSRRLTALLVVAGSLALLLVLVVSFVGYQAVRLSNGLISRNLISGHGVSGEQNILLMGLDSRLDESGRPLSRALYSTLHTGNETTGGENANVLMFIHIPRGGHRAVAFSIPRDDEVQFPNCPLHECHGKIKQAYGLAFAQAEAQLAAQGVKAGESRVQQQRDAGRKEEIATVEQFLGNGLHIDHFVEVTLVAFYELAKVVQPITVCLKEPTKDTYSGADFHAGKQDIDAKQAVAFVRQRRDTSNPNLGFTDLDRERRQQAFIASVVHQLKQAGTLADPGKLSSIVDVTKANLAVDSGLGLLDLARLGNRLSGSVTFYTLPVKRFGRNSRGEDVNLIDLPVLQATVQRIVQGSEDGHAGGSSPRPSPSASADLGSATVDVLNATGRRGLARRVAGLLTAGGYRVGSTGTTAAGGATAVGYGSGADGVAQALAARVGVSATADPTLPAGRVRLTLGAGFRSRVLGAGSRAGSPTPAPTLSAVPGEGSGPGGPPVTALTALTSGGIPCVK